jgi:hypothetical protein
VQVFGIRIGSPGSKLAGTPTTTSITDATTSTKLYAYVSLNDLFSSNANSSFQPCCAPPALRLRTAGGAPAGHARPWIDSAGHHDPCAGSALISPSITNPTHRPIPSNPTSSPPRRAPSHASPRLSSSPASRCRCASSALRTASALHPRHKLPPRRRGRTPRPRLSPRLPRYRRRSLCMRARAASMCVCFFILYLVLG